jgi:hypothetical protein
MDWFAGDDWQINATLLDVNGDPFDLSVPNEIQWALLDNRGQRVLDEDDASITITEALAGKCTIVVAAAKTAPLPTGHFSDAIRIVQGGITSTLTQGLIYVTANPWALQAAARPALRRIA